MQKAVKEEVEEGLGSILRTSLAERMDGATQRINLYLVDKKLLYRHWKVIVSRPVDLKLPLQSMHLIQRLASLNDNRWNARQNSKWRQWRALFVDFLLDWSDICLLLSHTVET